MSSSSETSGSEQAAGPSTNVEELDSSASSDPGLREGRQVVVKRTMVTKRAERRQLVVFIDNNEEENLADSPCLYVGCQPSSGGQRRLVKLSSCLGSDDDELPPTPPAEKRLRGDESNGADGVDCDSSVVEVDESDNEVEEDDDYIDETEDNVVGGSVKEEVRDEEECEEEIVEVGVDEVEVDVDEEENEKEVRRKEKDIEEEAGREMEEGEICSDDDENASLDDDEMKKMEEISSSYDSSKDEYSNSSTVDESQCHHSDKKLQRLSWRLTYTFEAILTDTCSLIFLSYVSSFLFTR